MCSILSIVAEVVRWVGVPSVFFYYSFTWVFPDLLSGSSATVAICISGNTCTNRLHSEVSSVGAFFFFFFLLYADKFLQSVLLCEKCVGCSLSYENISCLALYG